MKRALIDIADKLDATALFLAKLRSAMDVLRGAIGLRRAVHAQEHQGGSG
jgi:hypothetical protein